MEGSWPAGEALKYLYRDPFKAQVATMKVHGAFGNWNRR